MFTENGNHDETISQGPRLSPDEEAFQSACRRLTMMEDEVLRASKGSMARAVNGWMRRLLADNELLRALGRLRLEQRTQEESGAGDQESHGRSAHSDHVSRPASNEAPSGTSLRTGAIGSAGTGGEPHGTIGHTTQPSRGLSTSPSKPRRSHLSPGIIARSAIDFRSRRFGSERVNGLPWWEVTPEQGFSSAERHKAFGYFLQYVAQHCADPRKPMGDQVSEDVIEQAERFGQEKAAA